MQNNNSNKIILITGASRGFGLLFTEQLAKEKYTIYASARNLEKSQELQELSQKYSNIQIVKLDVNNKEDINSCKNLIKHDCQDNSRKFLSLINNAGYGLMGQVGEIEKEKLENQFATNTFAPILLANSFLDLLQDGVVINISSVASYFGLPYFGAYSASKAALNILSMSLAVENKQKNLSVIVIQPGPFATDFRNSIEYAGSGEFSNYDLRPKMFKNRENPQKVVETISKVIKKKTENKLERYKEIPLGSNANILRLVSRWLDLNILVKILSTKINN